MNALIFIKRRHLGDMEIHYAVHIIFSLTFFLKNRFKRVCAYVRENMRAQSSIPFFTCT